MRYNTKQTVVLCIMDGWGINKEKDFNAVALAKTPNFDYLTKNYPFSTLDASGEEVGLPAGQVGNSEVGHMNLGAGRIVLQTLPKINEAFKKNKIRFNENFKNFISKHKKGKNIHLLGLCSDGGVHSHLNHLILISELLNKIFLDDKAIPFEFLIVLHATTFVLYFFKIKFLTKKYC